MNEYEEYEYDDSEEYKDESPFADATWYLYLYICIGHSVTLS